VRSIKRRGRAVGALLLCIGAVTVAVPVGAQADTPSHTDVMFVFDTTGSMSGAISEAQSGIQEAMSQISATLPDSQFGLVEVSDYDEVVNPGEFEYGIGEGRPAWTLHVPITSNQSQVSDALLNLSADGGGDSPEAYGRALFESATNPAIGWRAGARSVIVLVADDVPHDNDLNEGIPPEVFAQPSPFDTGIDPGADNTVGNGDDLDWQGTVLQRLILEGRPLEYVDYFGAEEYFPYWENWTGRTGGSVVHAEGSGLPEKIVEAVKAGATSALPACPGGQIRNASNQCVTAPPPPPPPPSNNFKFEPRISCARGCHVVLVKIVFDSAGKVVGESIPEEEKAGASAVASAAGKAKACSKAKGKKKGKCKRPALIKKFSRPVVAGENTLRLKLTGPAIAALNKKSKVKLAVRFTFTPNGGSAKAEAHTYTVKLPKKGKKHGPKK
jgi:von Willebrand factor type A domain